MGKQKYWAIIPAAGFGKRMGTTTPKQYLNLHGKPVLFHAIKALLSHPAIEELVVAIAPNDPYWPSVLETLSEKQRIITVNGGQERFHSVMNALTILSEKVDDDDWVLVHDAVRPCLSQQDLTALIKNLSEHKIGGLLGSPVRDTLKRINQDNEIIETIDRSNTWQAQTPQMFRYGPLKKALQHATKNNHAITDEASAFERMGMQPKMVLGHPNNIKITHPEDLVWVERYWDLHNIR